MTAPSSPNRPSPNAVRQMLTRAAVVSGFAIGVVIAWPPTPTVWTVVGDSMAPNLTGSHLVWTCPDCQFRFATTIGEQGSALSLPVRRAIKKQWDTRATCPNCGLRNIHPQCATARGPQSALVEPSEKVERFDLAAYRNADGLKMVKRVVGLPGEQLELREGDLWINGQRIQRTLTQTRRMAVLVNDSRHVSQQAPRWRVEPPQHWTKSGVVQQCRHNGQLIYQHRVSYESPASRSSPAPIRDHYAFNLLTSRQPNIVRDIFFETWLKLKNDQTLWITLVVKGRKESEQVTFRGTIQSDSVRWTVRRSSEGPPTPTSEMRWKTGPDSTWRRIWAGVIDGRAILACDGNVVLECPTDQVSGVVGTPPQDGEVLRLSIRGHSQLSATMISGMRLWRDLHYDAVLGKPTQWQLGPDQWFLLGDNTAVSIDSRWTGPIPRRRWLGKVRFE